MGHSYGPTCLFTSAPSWPKALNRVVSSKGDNLEMPTKAPHLTQGKTSVTDRPTRFPTGRWLAPAAGPSTLSPPLSVRGVLVFSEKHIPYLRALLPAVFDLVHATPHLSVCWLVAVSLCPWPSEWSAALPAMISSPCLVPWKLPTPDTSASCRFLLLKDLSHANRRAWPM